MVESDGRADNKFLKKHGPQAAVDIIIERALQRRIKYQKLSCALAFRIAEELAVSPSEVGRTADLMGLRIVKCQLGLFGYRPHKSIVPRLDVIPPELEQMIRDCTENGGLDCRSAWHIADRLKMYKIRVSSACDGLGIKIRHCQLGAF